MSRNQPDQLPLLLPLEAGSAREDLVVSDANRAAITMIDAWPHWPSSVVVISGPPGCGKTHLADIWAAKADARIVSKSSRFDEIDSIDGPLLIEDLAQGAFSESLLFHVLNTVRATNSHLLLTSQRRPGNWGITLPDLQSRIKLATLVEISEPDDALLRGVLYKLFSDRQLSVETHVINYLLDRMERSLEFARKIAETIDRLSLSRSTGVTKPLVREALALLESED